MTNEDPYVPPESDVLSSEDTSTPTSRKDLIPLWIKVFGWLFIVFGALVTVVAGYSAITGEIGEFSIYGIEVSGSIYNPIVLFVVLLIIAHGICAYGLLFEKSWGVISCMLLAYLSIAICIVTMFVGDEFNIRLELAFLVPYVIKLHKIKEQWKTAGANLAFSE